MICCQRRLDPSFFIVLRHVLDLNAATAPLQETLRDFLLRDTLSRAADNDITVFQLVLENLNDYVEIVHHSGYSGPLMQCKLCFCLRNLAFVDQF